MAKRFTFADAKKKIKELEGKLDEAKTKAGNLILDTSDNVFSKQELKKIRFLEVWAILGPIVGTIIGLLF